MTTLAEGNTSAVSAGITTELLTWSTQTCCSPFINTTAPPSEPSGRPVALIVIEASILCLMWLFGSTGNLLVCVVIYRSRRLQSTTNYFVVSLAVTDLLTVFMCMPFVLTRVIAGSWVLTDGLCKLVRAQQWLALMASSYLMLSICVDRFYTIIYPLSFKITKSTAKNMIIISWILSIVLAGPSFYFYKVETIDGVRMCTTFLSSQWNTILYVLILVVVCYAVPLIGTLTGYVRIGRYIWKAGVGGRTLQRTTNSVPRAKVKMVKMIMAVNFIYFGLISPFVLLNLVFVLLPTQSENPSIYIAVVWFSFSTVVAKPLIYLCYNSNFRRGCKEIFCMSTMKCYRSNAYAITTMSRFAKKNHVGVIDAASEYRRMDSPSKTFDRSTMIEKVAWPLASQSPSTYL